MTGIVTSISCAFSASSSLLQILRNSSRRHSVLMLLSLSSVTNLSLLFGFCAACMLSCKCLYMKWWAAVTVTQWCHSFAACTVDVCCFVLIKPILGNRLRSRCFLKGGPRSTHPRNGSPTYHLALSPLREPGVARAHHWPQLRRWLHRSPPLPL